MEATNNTQAINNVDLNSKYRVFLAILSMVPSFVLVLITAAYRLINGTDNGFMNIVSLVVAICGGLFAAYVALAYYTQAHIHCEFIYMIKESSIVTKHFINCFVVSLIPAFVFIVNDSIIASILSLIAFIAVFVLIFKTRMYFCCPPLIITGYSFYEATIDLLDDNGDLKPNGFVIVSKNEVISGEYTGVVRIDNNLFMC